MARNIALRQSSSDPPSPPTLSPVVRDAVAHYLNPARGDEPRVRSLPAHLRDRAGAYVASVDMRPADAATIRRWMLPIAAAVNVTPADGDAAARAGAVALACQDLPGWVFNEDTLRAAVAEFKWWPSAAEVRALVADETREARMTIKALAALAEAPPAAEPDAMDPQARAIVADTMRSWLAERTAQVNARDAAENGSPEQARPRARHLTPEQLAIVRRPPGAA